MTPESSSSDTPQLFDGMESERRSVRAGPPRPTRSLEVRIAQRVTADGSAIIPPRIARWIEDTCKLTADRRIKLRDTDPDAYVALAALHLAALSSDSGTNQAAAQPDKQLLNTWMSTSDVAKALNRTDRCVRKWCSTGRLQAEIIGGRWLVNPTSIALLTNGENT